MIPNTVTALLARARSAVGHGVTYDLGAGGMDPDAPHPWDSRKGCDCSGFVAWAFGVSRQTHLPLYDNYNGGWINTDAMKHDALTDGAGLFTRIVAPRPGAIAVYGAKLPARRYGHVGIISAVTPEGRIGRVIHCSSGNYRTRKDAIQETAPGTAFGPADMILAWRDGLTPDGDALSVPRMPYRTWAIVTASELNLRATPDTTSAPVGALRRGDVAVISAVTHSGQSVDGNGAWYQLSDSQLWLWAGGTDVPTPTAGLMP